MSTVSGPLSLQALSFRRVADSEVLYSASGRLLPALFRKRVDEFRNKFGYYSGIFAKLFKIPYEWIVIDSELNMNWRQTALRCLSAAEITGAWSDDLRALFRSFCTSPSEYSIQRLCITAKQAFEFAAVNLLNRVCCILWETLNNEEKEDLLSVRNTNWMSSVAAYSMLGPAGGIQALQIACQASAGTGWPMLLKTQWNQLQINPLECFDRAIEARNYHVLDILSLKNPWP